MSSSFVYTMELQMERPNSLYSIGETVKIHPAVFAGSCILGTGDISWELYENISHKIADGRVKLGIPGAAISFKAEKAATYQCRAKYKPEGADEIEALIGFAVEPEKIACNWQAPADFDDFWEVQKKRLAQIPLQAKLKPIESAGFQAFDLKVDCVDDIPVSGLLLVPENSGKANCPAIINLHGAGVQSAVYNSIVPFVKKGFLALDINAHGLPNLEKPEFYQELALGELADYRTRHFLSGSPDKIYFVNMFLRVKRAVEFMASRPEWDGRNMILMGTSQGGFQSFAGAYLDRRVSAVAAGVPAGCSIIDYGWPFCGGTTHLKQDAVLNLKNNAPYVDVVSFASKIDIPLAVTVGLIDGTCPAHGVYAAFNACLSSNKVIYAGPQTAHAVDPVLWGPCLKFLESNLR